MAVKVVRYKMLFPELGAVPHSDIYCRLKVEVVTVVTV